MPCLRHCAHASLYVVYPSTDTQAHKIFFFYNGVAVLLCFLLALLSEEQNLFCLNHAPVLYHHS